MALDRAPDPVSRENLIAALPSVVASVRGERLPVNNATVREALYTAVIEGLARPDCFGSIEPEPNGLTGTFIKGYLRDVTSYLQGAYRTIHTIDFENEFSDILYLQPKAA